MSREAGVRSLTRVAVYERQIQASLERIWENVLDWEHLPSLHYESFTEIRCLDSGDWGWSARVGLPPVGTGPSVGIELRTDPENLRYVAETVQGAGKGTEIWTYLNPIAEHRTGIRVEFLVPEVPSEAAARLGEGYTALYTRLWDQDEGMMQHRERMLALLLRASERQVLPLELGPLREVRERLPFRVEFGGRPFRLIDLDGEIVIHSCICPHLLGPLDEAPLVDGQIECPWHGYRFDPRTGRGAEIDRLELATPPQIEIDPATSAVRLV